MVVTLLTVLCVVFMSLEDMALAQERIRIAWVGASPANRGDSGEEATSKTGRGTRNHKYQREPNRPSGPSRRRN
jgi:hypothetical protein